MSGVMKSLSFALLLMALFCQRTNAQTINAASCSSADVEIALAAVVADGTTVNIPAGNCTWTTPVMYTQVFSMTIAGAGAQTPAGGTDRTIIVDGVSHSPTDNPTFQVSTAAGKSFRLTGIAIHGLSSNSAPSYNGIVRIQGLSQAMRIDHCHFYGLNLVDMTIDGWIYGVVDHNLFDATVSVNFGVRIGQGRWNGAPGDGNLSWTDTEHFGSNQFVFLEDNTFNWLNSTSSPNSYGAVNDCNDGGRFVFRHNTMNGFLYVQTHEMAQDIRGCRAYEIYDNTANTTLDTAGSAAGNFAFFFQTRMGTGLLWGNNVTGYKQVANFSQDRTQGPSGGHPQIAPSGGWGYCGTTYGPSPWDGNTDSSGYPCVDQIGRGQGDLLTGLFPNKLNSTTGTISSVQNAQVPLYIWDNTFSPLPNDTDSYGASQDPATIAENRDYYLQLPNINESATFNGTAGIGQGLLSERPATCTPLTAYWATDTNTLYQCATPNSWTTYYTPYTYPHPLVTGETAGPPTAPTNLTATVN